MFGRTKRLEARIETLEREVRDLIARQDKVAVFIQNMIERQAREKAEQQRLVVKYADESAPSWFTATNKTEAR